MSGYFLSMARLALGIGPRVEPLLPVAGHDEGWIEVEPTASTPSEQTPTPTLLPGVQVYESPGEGSRADFDPELPEPAHDTLREVHRTDRQVHRETLEREKAVHESRTQETRTRETQQVRETLSQLLREARTEHLRVLRETSTTHTETQSEREVRTERERILRTQIESRMETVEKQLRISGPPSEERIPVREETSYDIHIGRIDVRLDGTATPAQPTESENPKGALSLDEYLKLRSRGEA
ncbi:MAG: hypothetical protein KF784_00460 [Fimbriimonadaceae bacterium]|nr:hypothetical protein [Fimbriimonadaceae bacterium]